MQVPHNHKPIKRIENLARTGIEYPFLRERRHFIMNHKEFEPLSEQVVPSHILDEFTRNDADRACATPGQYPVVYDCIEASPYWEDVPGDPFIDERDLIELPPVTE
jgi:hypothetical protein